MRSKVWNPSSERERLLTLGACPATELGLEIGALHNPIIPQEQNSIHFVDYANTQTLKSIHADKPLWVERMVEVDYVWSGSGSLSDIVGGYNIYDYIIASHVIEHIPNMLGWFRGLEEVLKPGGVFNLAIPDKRFTFDIRCPESTVGQLVEADLLQYVRPSIRQMFDHCFYAKAIDPGEIWTKKIDVDAVTAYSGDIAQSLALSQAHQILDRGRYVDSHCWIFTPLTFLNLLEGIIELELFSFIPTHFVSTPIGAFEFYLSLRKSTNISKTELKVAQKTELTRLKSQCLDQARWSQLLSS